MTTEQIKNLTAMQFDKVLSREGRTVTNAYTNEEYHIFFRKNDSQSVSQGIIPQEKVTIYYRQDVPIQKGMTIQYKTDYYIVANINNLESDVYFKSTCIRCNAVWNLKGQLLPVISDTLTMTSPNSNGTITMVSGNISVQTTDIPFLHSNFNIDTMVSVSGGIYKLTNKFFCDGLAFLSFERDAYYSGADTITYNGDTEFEIGTYTFAPSVMHGDIIIADANVTYSSSDESIATVKGNEISFLSEGSVIITMSAQGIIENGADIHTYNCSTDVTITVTNSGTPDVPDVPDVPVEPTVTYTATISDTDVTYLSDTGYWDVTLYADGVKVTDEATATAANVTYKITSPKDFVHTDTWKWNTNAFELTIYTEDDTILGETITIEVYINGTLADSQIVEVLGGL